MSISTSSVPRPGNEEHDGSGTMAMMDKFVDSAAVGDDYDCFFSSWPYHNSNQSLSPYLLPSKNCRGIYLLYLPICFGPLHTNITSFIFLEVAPEANVKRQP